MENIVNNPNEFEEDLQNTDSNFLASRWDRLWASLIDGLTIMPITMPLMYFTGGFDGISEGIEPSLAYNLSMALISTAIFLLIHGKFIARDGQTIGKRILNIKIVTIDGDHADIPTLAKRYGFYWGIPQIPLLGPFINMISIFFIFTKSKRCLHDHVAGTKVIIASK